MLNKGTTLIVQATSGTTASQQLLFTGIDIARSEILVIDASVTGNAGGTLDIFLERVVGGAVGSPGAYFADFAHYPQLTIAQAPTKYTFTINMLGGGSNTSTGSNPILVTTQQTTAAGTFINTQPGGDIWATFNPGSGTSGGAVHTFYLTPYWTV